MPQTSVCPNLASSPPPIYSHCPFFSWLLGPYFIPFSLQTHAAIASLPPGFIVYILLPPPAPSLSLLTYSSVTPSPLAQVVTITLSSSLNLFFPILLAPSFSVPLQHLHVIFVLPSFPYFMVESFCQDSPSSIPVLQIHVRSASPHLPQLSLHVPNLDLLICPLPASASVSSSNLSVPLSQLVHRPPYLVDCQPEFPPSKEASLARINPIPPLHFLDQLVPVPPLPVTFFSPLFTPSHAKLLTIYFFPTFLSCFLCVFKWDGFLFHPAWVPVEWLLRACFSVLMPRALPRLFWEESI